MLLLATSRVRDDNTFERERLLVVDSVPTIVARSYCCWMMTTRGPHSATPAPNRDSANASLAKCDAWTIETPRVVVVVHTTRRQHGCWQSCHSSPCWSTTRYGDQSPRRVQNRRTRHPCHEWEWSPIRRRRLSLDRLEGVDRPTLEKSDCPLGPEYDLVATAQSRILEFVAVDRREPWDRKSNAKCHSNESRAVIHVGRHRAIG